LDGIVDFMLNESLLTSGLRLVEELHIIRGLDPDAMATLVSLIEPFIDSLLIKCVHSPVLHKLDAALFKRCSGLCAVVHHGEFAVAILDGDGGVDWVEVGSYVVIVFIIILLEVPSWSVI